MLRQRAGIALIITDPSKYDKDDDDDDDGDNDLSAFQSRKSGCNMGPQGHVSCRELRRLRFVCSMGGDYSEKRRFAKRTSPFCIAAHASILCLSGADGCQWMCANWCAPDVDRRDCFSLVCNPSNERDCPGSYCHEECEDDGIDISPPDSPVKIVALSIMFGLLVLTCCCVCCWYRRFFFSYYCVDEDPDLQAAAEAGRRRSEGDASADDSWLEADARYGVGCSDHTYDLDEFHQKDSVRAQVLRSNTKHEGNLRIHSADEKHKAARYNDNLGYNRQVDTGTRRAGAVPTMSDAARAALSPRPEPRRSRHSTQSSSSGKTHVADEELAAHKGAERHSPRAKEVARVSDHSTGSKESPVPNYPTKEDLEACQDASDDKPHETAHHSATHKPSHKKRKSSNAKGKEKSAHTEKMEMPKDLEEKKAADRKSNHKKKKTIETKATAKAALSHSVTTHLVNVAKKIDESLPASKRVKGDSFSLDGSYALGSLSLSATVVQLASRIKLMEKQMKAQEHAYVKPTDGLSAPDDKVAEKQLESQEISSSERGGECDVPLAKVIEEQVADLQSFAVPLAKDRSSRTRGPVWRPGPGPALPSPRRMAEVWNDPMLCAVSSADMEAWKPCVLESHPGLPGHEPSKVDAVRKSGRTTSQDNSGCSGST